MGLHHHMRTNDSVTVLNQFFCNTAVHSIDDVSDCICELIQCSRRWLRFPTYTYSKGYNMNEPLQDDRPFSPRVNMRERNVRCAFQSCVHGGPRAGRAGGLESRPHPCARMNKPIYHMHTFRAGGGGWCSKLSGALLLGPRPEPSVGHDEATQLCEITWISLDISGSLLIASVPILTLPFLSLPSSPLGPAQASALPSPSARFPASDRRACASVVRK